MKPHHFGRALLHARFELGRFEKALCRLEAYDFPSDVAKTLISQQQQFIEACALSLGKIETDYEDDPRGSASRLVSEYRKLSANRRHLEVLEKSRSDEVPWSLVPSIERLGSEILPNRPILITTTVDMNYMVGWSLSSDQPVVTVYLPKLHRANAFLHVLIAHELFHPAVESFLPSERVLITPRLREECRKLLADIDPAPADLFSKKRLDNLLQSALDAWEKALTELMCDLGAVAVFGPAAFWSLSGFAALHELDTVPSQQNQYYPPWRLRLKSAFDFLHQSDNGIALVKELTSSLRKAGFEKHADAIESSLRNEAEVVSVEKSMAQIKSDPFLAKIYEHVFDSLERGKTHVLSIANGIVKRWTNSLNQVPDLIKRLVLLVPPSEILLPGRQVSQPAELTAIVMACWIERLNCESEGTLDIVAFRRLCRLLLKAIEDAELKRQFIQWRDE